MRTYIPEGSANDDPATLAALLGDAGCLVVHDVLNEQRRSEIRAELAPHMADARVDTAVPEEEFYPGYTRRVSALVARSESCHSLITDDLTRTLCDHHLGENCTDHQLHVSAALEIGPGAREQILHREEDSFTFFPLPRPTIIVATMWAISDFTAANGATLIVPGSHRWTEDREATPEEVVPAEMPAGSMLFWLGGTLHGAGANTSNDWRYGLILTYSLGWVRQEENQYLNVPPALAETLPSNLQKTLGFEMYRALGFYDKRVGKQYL